MKLPARSWVNHVATEALAQALGALLAALVFVLGAAGFGVVTSLSAAELVAIAGVAIGLAVALAAFGVMWRQYAEAAEEREREEVLARVVADAIELSRRRDEEIQQMKEEGKLYPE